MFRRAGRPLCCGASASVDIPGSKGSLEDSAKALVNFIYSVTVADPSRPGVVFLTGAGCSTASGIPDYRSPNGLYSKGHQPMTLQQFMTPHGQRRYFARSVLGFSTVRDAMPNAAHDAIAAMVRRGTASHVVTQNVDGLHVIAADGRPVDGHSTVTELHGSIHLVKCLGCGDRTPRAQLQTRLEDRNAALLDEWRREAARGGEEHSFGLRPDGDHVATTEFVSRFELVSCAKCQRGVLMPAMVFFGDNVDKALVERTFATVRGASALVCLGTSLQVYSAYRFVVAARDANIPIAIVNQGPTKGDDKADLKIDAPLHQLLPQVAHSLQRLSF